MVYGPGDRQHRLRWIVEAVRRDGRLEIDAEAAAWRTTYGYVTNVAEAIALAAVDDKAAGRIYNVGEPEARRADELAALVAQAMGWSVEIETVPPEQRGLLWELAERSVLDYPLELDTQRIRAELGFAEAVGTAEALQRTVAWEEESLAPVQ